MRFLAHLAMRSTRTMDGQEPHGMNLTDSNRGSLTASGISSPCPADAKFGVSSLNLPRCLGFHRVWRGVSFNAMCLPVMLRVERMRWKGLTVWDFEALRRQTRPLV